MLVLTSLMEKVVRPNSYLFKWASLVLGFSYYFFFNRAVEVCVLWTKEINKHQVIERHQYQFQSV